MYLFYFYVFFNYNYIEVLNVNKKVLKFMAIFLTLIMVASFVASIVVWFI